MRWRGEADGRGERILYAAAEAAEALGIAVRSADTKGGIISKLNRHQDTEEMTAAVHSAAGEET